MKSYVFPEGILDLIGNTPLVRIKNLNPNPDVEIWVKLECHNPGGSVKDRIARTMILHAEETGELTKDKIILEATSGNTGIGLALVGAAKGYKVMLAMSEAVSSERRQILSALGAEFLLTPPELGTDGAIEVVYRLQRREPGKYFIPDQYNNPCNPLAHYNGTGMEIIEQTEGKITHFIAAVGTSGTLMGVSRRLREFNPEIKIIGVEPYLGHKIQGLKNMKEAYRPGIFNRKSLDEKINVHDEDAYETARLLASREGLFVGMSSGAAMFVALQKAKTLRSGILTVILPDGGERYLSTTLFQSAALPKVKPCLELYNTLIRARLPFKPVQQNQVSIYTCGPTVHAEPHLGLLRRVLATDILRRYLEYCGFRVKHVMNITDIDDRTIEESEKQGKSLKDLTDFYTEEFMKNLDTLNVKKAEKYPRASEEIEEMIRFTKKLTEKGIAYEKLRSVYFNISKFEQYGKLSGIDMNKIRIGSTVDLDDYEKDSPRDFTLFKRSTLAEMKRDIFYESEWGNVRPGWHVECAAMSTRYLGEQFDIHTSGTDLVFPHNENEIALCQALYGKIPANFWFHIDLVFMNGKKMSRSAGNAVSLNDLVNQGFSGREIRYVLISTHYRQPMSFSIEKVKAARSAVRRLDSFIWHLKKASGKKEIEEIKSIISEMLSGFESAMNSDLNVSMALGNIFTMIRRVNTYLVSNELSYRDADKILSSLKKIDSIFAVCDFEPEKQEILSPEIESLISLREQARVEKNYAEADRIREELKKQGFSIEDTVHGTLFWKDKENNME
jgi:cysteinyl-tRNA synthetase